MNYINIIIKHIFLLVIIFNAKSSLVFASLTSSRIVRTKYGELSGLVSTPSDRLDAVEIFRGVPYALPPVGHLRFMPPVSGALWSGVKVADRFSPVCPQNLPSPVRMRANNTNAHPRGRLEYLHRLIPYLTNQSEDCLYLNIYAPAQGGSRETGPRKYPVMVFIHGESYEWNSGNAYDGSVLASYGGVVVVTVNYRLGILGFLNTNTDVHMRLPSNYGLMDQIAALHWIQENIGYFNGDPSNVTLVGHGTGAACVNFLMISPAVPDGLLFHRAILMSGSALSPWALVRDPARYARQVAKHAACPRDLSHTELLKCLREKPLELLLSTPVVAPEFTTAFGPSIDGVIIDTGLSETRPANNKDSHSYDYHTQNSPGRPPPPPSASENINEAIAAGGYGNAVLSNAIAKKAMVSKLTRYDLLLGVVKAEAFFTFTGDDIQYGIEPDRRSKILRTFVKNTYRYHLSEILATIINEYTDWERPVQHPVNIRDETLEALSDAMVVAPSVNTADLHSSARRNSYLYVFDYQTKNGDYQQRQGCIHGEELPYLFGAPLVGGVNHFPRNFTKSEILLSEATMIYFSNFARTGNPNDAQDGGDMVHNTVRAERTKFKNIEWTAYESVHKKYLSLDMKPKLKNHYRAHRLSFWLNLVPDLHKPGSDDVPRSHHMLGDDDDEINEIPHSTSSPGKHQAPPSTYQNYGPSASHNLVNLTSNDIIHQQASASVVKVAPSSGRDLQEDLPDGSVAASGQEDGFAAYSTALSVTVAIGCSLLILNVLIFAGVYYQRDKSRQGGSGHQDSAGSIHSNTSSNGSQNGAGMIKQRRQENGGPMSNISADYLYVSGAPELLQIVETSRSSPRSGGGTGPSILKKPPLENSSILVLQPPHRYPPIEFQDVKISCSATLPRAPPPPRLPESQPLLSGGGTLGRYKPQHKTIDELKV